MQDGRQPQPMDTEAVPGTTQALLQSLEGISHGARMQRMLAFGRASVDDPAAQSILVQLATSHGFFGKLLALQACRGSQDARLALEMRDSSSVKLRQLALMVLLDVASDDMLAQVLATTPEFELKPLLRKLRKTRGALLMDNLAEAAAQQQNTSLLQELLPFTSGATVEQLWPQVEESSSSLTWGRLANYHPEYVVQRVCNTELKHRCKRVRDTLPCLLQHLPDQAWACYASVPLAEYLSQLHREDLSRVLLLLLRRFPQQLMDHLLSVQVPSSFSTVLAVEHVSELYTLLEKTSNAVKTVPQHLPSLAHKLTSVQLLAGVLEGAVPVLEVLKRLPVAERVRLFAAWRKWWHQTHQALAGLQAAEAGSASKEHIDSIILAAQQHAFGPWLGFVSPGAGTGARHISTCPPGWAGMLKRWLPARERAQIMSLVVNEAPALLRAQLKSETFLQMLEALEPSDLAALLPRLRSLETNCRLRLLACLTAEQQLDIFRESRKVTTRASQQRTAQRADLPLPMLCASWPYLNERLCGAGTAHMAEAFVASPETLRTHLLQTWDALEMWQRELYPGLKEEACGQVFEEWLTWWEATRQLPGTMLCDTSDGTGGRQAIARSMRRDAFQPWTVYNHLLPPMQLARLLHRLLSEAADVQQQLLSAVNMAVALRRVEAAGRVEVAKAAPELFIREPQLLATLPEAQQVELVERWRAGRQATEQQLASLLGAAPVALSTKLASSVKSLVQRDPLAANGLTCLSEGAKRALYAACAPAWLGWADGSCIALLPEPQRAQLARAKMLQAAKQDWVGPAQIWAQVKPVALYLPWEELLAVPQLAQLLDHRDAAERVKGLRVLLEAVEAVPANLPKLLELLHRKRREQDPVRQVALDGLVNLDLGAPAVYAKYSVAEHLPALRTIVDDARSAKDLSPTSLHQLGCLVLALLPHNVGWSCECFALCVKVLGSKAVPTTSLKATINSHAATCSTKEAAVVFFQDIVTNVSCIFDALTERQDGAMGMIDLLHMLHTACIKAEVNQDKVMLRLDDLLNKCLPTIETARSGIDITSTSTMDIMRRILTKRPDAFLQVVHHLLPADASVATAAEAYVESLLDDVHTPEHLLPFALRNSTMPGVAAAAVHKLFRKRADQQGVRAEHLDALVAQLLQRDISFAILPPVWSHLLNCRQDLLTPLLSLSQLPDGSLFRDGPPRMSSGRSSGYKRRRYSSYGFMGDSRVSFWLSTGTNRALFKLEPQQQATLAGTLLRVLSKGGLDTDDTQLLITQLAALPSAPVGPLLALLNAPATPGSLPTAAREAALATLARLDDTQQAWDALVEACKGEQANAAVAAIGSLVKGKKGWATSGGFEEVWARLRALPWKRVVVLKEVIRVLGSLAVDEPRALQELLALAANPDVHKSARVQLLACLLPFCGQAQVQAVFLAAAASAEAEVACAAAVVPERRLLQQPGVTEHVVALFDALLQHADGDVRVAAMQAWAAAWPPVPLDAGLPIAQRLMAIGKPRAQQEQQAGTVSQYEAGQARTALSGWLKQVTTELAQA